MLLIGDALDTLHTLKAQSVHCCVTSPPYWGLRDYGHDGQIGLEATPQEYVAKMVEVFREVRRVLVCDGSLWLNLGDCYEDKNLVGIPWRVALALQADGWYLRSDIIWHKPNPMPESVTDRPTRAHEYIFLLTKSRSYYYDADAIREPAVREGSGNKERKVSAEGERQRRNTHLGSSIPWTNDGTGRNRRDVWTINSKPYSGAHFAVFPPTLIKPCILAGCPVGGVVLDPFLGSGTTARAAMDLGRQWVGIELNADYQPLIEERTAQQTLWRQEQHDAQ